MLRWWGRGSALVMWFPSCRMQGQSCWGPLSAVSLPENEDDTGRKAEMSDGERKRSPASLTPRSTVPEEKLTCFNR